MFELYKVYQKNLRDLSNEDEFKHFRVPKVPIRSRYADGYKGDKQYETDIKRYDSVKSKNNAIDDKFEARKMDLDKEYKRIVFEHFGIENHPKREKMFEIVESLQEHVPNDIIEKVISCIAL